MSPVDVSTLVGHTRNFLGQVGFPTRDYVLGRIDRPEAAGEGGYATAGLVDFPKAMPAVQSLAARYGRRGRLTYPQQEAARLLLHEGLHQVRAGRTETWGPQEEGATESVAQDLLPIFSQRIFGHRLKGPKVRSERVGTAYPEQVNDIRQLSVFGSGAGDFTKRSARVWRRQFLHADESERQRMHDQAISARDAVLAARGR